MLESKNLELAGSYHQEPSLIRHCCPGVKNRLPFLRLISAIPEASWKMLLPAIKRWFWKPSLEPCVISIMGIFPYTSSSSTISAYGPIGAGIPGESLDHVVGVLKAYSTCVGAGPFVAERAMSEDWCNILRKFGNEYGAATGRPRRVGPFDAVASRYG